MKCIKTFKYIFLLVYCLTYSNVATSNNLDNKYVKAGKLIEEGNYEKAIFLYEEILKNNHEIDSYKKSRIFNNIGYCNYKQNEWENAIKFYKMALEIDNNYGVCLNNIAAALMNKNKHKEALLYLTKAYKLNDSNIKIIFNLFVSNYYLKNKEEALYYIEEAFNIDQNYTLKILKKNNISNSNIRKIRKYLKKKKNLQF